MTTIKNTKRDLILDSANSLILEKGYWDTKIIDIADAAGIGKGTIYEYFESKEAIFYELFKNKMEEYYNEMSMLENAEISCSDKISQYVEFEFTQVSKFAFSKNILMDLFMKMDTFRNPELVDAIHKLVGYKFSFLKKIIEEGVEKGEFKKVDSQMAAATIMGSVNFSLGFNSIDCQDIFPQIKAFKWDKYNFLELLFHGLKV